MPFPFFLREAKAAKECTKNCPDCLQKEADAEVERMRQGEAVSPELVQRLRKQLDEAFKANRDKALNLGNEWDGRL